MNERDICTVLDVPAVAWCDPKSHTPMWMSFYYKPDAPYEVIVNIQPRRGDPAQWVFGRNLLRELVINGKGGEKFGQVRMAFVRRCVIFHFSSPLGYMYTRVEGEAMIKFVNRIYARVPHGTEHLYHETDVEAELQRMISDG